MLGPKLTLKRVQKTDIESFFSNQNGKKLETTREVRNIHKFVEIK